MREQYRALAPDPDDGHRIRSADRLRQRRQSHAGSRHGEGDGVRRRLSIALGARTARVVRQPLIESILLSLAGGASGLGIAYAGTSQILRFAFPSLRGLAEIPISASPSLTVLLFALGISMIVGAAFAIAPAWMATRVHPIEAVTRRQPFHRAQPVLSHAKRWVVMQAALSPCFYARGIGTAHRRCTAPAGDSGLRIQSGSQDHPRTWMRGSGGDRPAQLTPLLASVFTIRSARIPGVESVAFKPVFAAQWK